MATQNFKRKLLLNLYREGKNITFVSFCPLREIKMSDTCRLFPPFGDPWPSSLLLFQKEITNLKIKLSLRCRAVFKWMCVTPLQVNGSMHSWEHIKKNILGIRIIQILILISLNYMRMFRIWSRWSLTFPLNGFIISLLFCFSYTLEIKLWLS